MSEIVCSLKVEIDASELEAVKRRYDLVSRHEVKAMIADFERRIRSMPHVLHEVRMRYG